MKKICASLSAVSVFRSAVHLPALQWIKQFFWGLYTEQLAPEELFEQYAAIFFALVEEEDIDFGTYLRRHLRFDENPFARAAAEGEVHPLLRRAAERDVELLNQLVMLDCSAIKAEMKDIFAEQYGDLIDGLPRWEVGAPLALEELAEAYRYDGYGLFARGHSFIWRNGEIELVAHPDRIRWEDMVGYTWQREAVMHNTRALIEGKMAANVLLHGDSGTGKSATVKALLHVPEFYNLRVIEVDREGLADLYRLMQLLAGKSQKFILFIDDLSFAGEDRVFSALKSILEGGLGMRPQNVVVYATSNRRHMVRETFGDRRGDDIHVAETIQENISLSDRFGLRVPYLALSKQEYLETVDRLAAQWNISADREMLHREAGGWEIAHGGRTPRVARQFIEYVASGQGTFA